MKKYECNNCKNPSPCVHWMAISDDATLNLMKITELKESEASLVERINEQRRYTGEAVKEVERLRAKIADLEKANELLRHMVNGGWGFTNEELALIDGFRSLKNNQAQKGQ